MKVKASIKADPSKGDILVRRRGRKQLTRA